MGHNILKRIKRFAMRYAVLFKGARRQKSSFASLSPAFFLK